MVKKHIYTSLTLLFFFFGKAQDVENDKKLKNFQTKEAFLDSIKNTFTNHEMSMCIDQRWVKELTTTEYSEEMFFDIEKMNFDEKVNFDMDIDLFKKRLEKLNQKSPFHINYNETLENTIKYYLKNRSRFYEKQMALAEYYFPIFEEKLAKYNIPLEIKYLAIVESALNPLAKSRVGATGLWQFMYETGKQYKLRVDSYVDERRDPVKASEAACQYMVNMYKIFGDWSMVLASYNCGPGNVSKAIRRSGGSNDYWEIRKYLPRETANYVPAFIATMYVYEYKNELGIHAKKAPVTYFETDTVRTKKALSFKQLSDLLDVSMEEIQLFNPIYKLNEIPFDENEMHFLRLPKNKIGVFLSNESKIYAYIDFVNNEKQRFAEYNKNKRKENLLVKDSVQASKIAINEETEKKSKEEIIVYEDVIKKKVKEITDKDYYKVKSGETLSEIADKNNVSISQLRKWNNKKGDFIDLNEVLVIEKKKKITVTEVVKKARKKVVTIEPKEENLVTENTEIKSEFIPKTTIKSNYEQEMEYVVQKGDSIFSISKKFPKLTVEELMKKNNLQDNNLQPGMKLKI